MEPSHPKNLERLLRDLPPTPAVLPRLMALLADFNSSSSAVLELIRLDPVLATAILRASQSAFYGLPQGNVENLDDAVAELGFKEVYRLVALYATTQIVKEPLTAYRLTPGAFWRKSVACALAMEALCSEHGDQQATGYTVGLLHAIGEVLISRLVQSHAEPHPFLTYLNANPLPEQERLAAGITQTSIAALAMRRWRFPDSLVEPIEYQFIPHDAPRFSQMAMRLRLGKWLAHLALDDEPTARAINPDFHFALSTPGNSFSGMIVDLRRGLADAARSLNGTGCAIA